jgi:ATP-dependent RNA helicase DDX54/DBP10
VFGFLLWNMSTTDVVKKAKTGSFQSMGLEKEILAGLNRMGYKAPTPVQRKALPPVLAGLDVVCMARTGSGKTCVFLLPMIQKLKTHQQFGVRGLVLSPTRELASQTFRFTKDMAKFTDLRIIDILGGDSIDGQFDALASKPDIIIATPGRLMHHLREISTFRLKSVKYLVFDEADRLFEMGFAEQLNEIVRECPTERQTVLFSATLPKMIVQFSRAGLKDPQLIRLDTDVKMSDELRLAYFCVRSNEKLAALLYLVRNIIPADQQTIIFTATRHHSELLHAVFNIIGISSTMVYGSMDQDARTANLKSFRQGYVSYLIVTDLAARGIDVPLLNNVINYHFPPSPKLFVHRCGRAARQGRIGFAFSLVDPEEMAFMMDVQNFLSHGVDSGYGKSDDDHSTYTLDEMTPKMIHTGLLPQDAIDEENDFVKRSLQEDDMLATMYRISENGLKQYKRTRSEATRDGVKAAKKTIKSEEIKTIHPLIAGCDVRRCGTDVVAKADFIRKLQTFRPAQTVFETGIGTGCAAYFATVANAGGLDVSKTKHKKASEVMKALREVTASALERNKVKLHSVIDTNKTHTDDEKSGDDEEDGDDGESESDDNDEFDEEDSENDVRVQALDDSSLVSFNPVQAKKRVSVAQRKRLRKYGSSEPSTSKNVDDEEQTETKANNFQDQKFYMSYGTEDTHETFAEESMQPLSNLRSSETFGATMMDNALLGVDPDEDLQNSRKRKLMRWDPKKRNFVKVSYTVFKEAV